MRGRQVSFRVDIMGLRRIVKAHHDTEFATTYIHTCDLKNFELVADAFTDMKPHTLNELSQVLNIPVTRVHVAMEFLQDRGAVERREYRRNFATSRSVYEDAMTEYEALRVGAY